MTYPHAPRGAAPIDTAGLNVPSCVDEEIEKATSLEVRASTVDGPGLDESGGVEATADPGRKVAVRGRRVHLAEADGLTDCLTGVLGCQLTPVDSAHGAFRLERAEKVVEITEFGHRLIQSVRGGARV